MHGACNLVYFIVVLCGCLMLDLVFKQLPDDKILVVSKLKAFADDNFIVSQMVQFYSELKETLWEKEKMMVASIFSFSRNVCERLVFQGCENQGLFWKGLTVPNDKVLDLTK